MMRLITDKRTKTFTAWRHKGEFFRDDRYQRIAGRCLNLVVPEKTKVTRENEDRRGDQARTLHWHPVT